MVSVLCREGGGHAPDLEEDGFGHLQSCRGLNEIAIAEAGVRELKKSAWLPISISTPCWVWAGIGLSFCKGLDCNHVTED